MQGDKHSKVPFDDRAALEELERLQKSIQAYRHQRAQAEGAFEDFVGGFRQPVEEPAKAGVPEAGLTAGAAAALPAPPRGAAPEPHVEAPSVQPDVAPEPVPASFPERFPAELPAARAGSLFSDEPEAAAPAALFTDPKPSRGRLPLILGIILAMIVGFVVTARFRQASLRPAPAPVEQTPAPAEEGAAAVPPTPPPAATGPSSAASGAAGAAVTPPSQAAAPGASTPAPAAGPAAPAEIRTVRRAWVRVLVDGRREVEREIEANARVPLPAGTTYVVRAGDAGAVHFFLKGQDLGPLGADAQVVTRTFPSSAR